MSTETDSINRDTLIVTSTYLGGFVVGYIFNILLARMLGPDAYGNFKVAEAFASLGAILALMGGSKAAARLVSDDVLGGNTDKVWAYIWFYLKVIIIVSISISIFSILAHYLHISIFDGSSYHPILLATLTIPFSAASAMIGCVFLISKKLGWAFIPWRIGFPLIRLLLCGVIFLAAGELSDTVAVFIMAITALLIFIVQFWHSIRLKLFSFSKLSVQHSQKVWLKTSVPIMFIVMIQISMVQVDIYMLEWMSGEQAVGHFAAAQTTSNLLTTIKNSLFAFIAPAIVLSLKEGQESISALYSKCFKLMCFTVLPLSFVVCGNASSILAWFGHNTELTYFTLLALTFGNVFDVILGLGVVWLQYSDYQKFAIRILIASLIANIILNAALIPVLDVEGAAIATAVVKTISAIAFTSIIFTKFRILPWGGISKIPLNPRATN